MAILLNAVTVDTDGPFTQIPPGDRFCTIASSNFGGGTVTLEAQDSNGNTIALQEDGVNLAVTAQRSFTVKVPTGRKIRATLTGSTTPAALTVELT